MRRTIGLVALVLALCTPAAQASAKVVTYKEDPKLFGTLDQGVTNCPKVNCGPTAAVNSFVYLQNAFSNVYKNPLVPTKNGKTPNAAEQTAVANNLGTNYMKNCCGNTKEGTAIGDFILGKMDYIEAPLLKGRVVGAGDPGSTTYAAQIAARWAKVIPNHPDAKKPPWVQDQTIPTLGFIAAQLKAKEDVELLMDNNDGQLDYLTLTGSVTTTPRTWERSTISIPQARKEVRTRSLVWPTTTPLRPTICSKGWKPRSSALSPSRRFRSPGHGFSSAPDWRSWVRCFVAG